MATIMAGGSKKDMIHARGKILIITNVECRAVKGGGVVIIIKYVVCLCSCCVSEAETRQKLLRTVKKEVGSSFTVLLPLHSSQR